MNPKQLRLMEIVGEFEKLEHLYAALGDDPMAQVCKGLQDVAEILAEEVGP